MTVFNSDPATQLATLSLHDALPISPPGTPRNDPPRPAPRHAVPREESAGRRAPTRRGRHLLMIRTRAGNRKSTRLNSSHLVISYAVFCLKKKNKLQITSQITYMNKK